MVARAEDLIGQGLPAPLAEWVGTSVAAVTAAGTTQGAATALGLNQTGVVLTTAGGADACKLPANAPLWREYIVAVTSATTGQVFPPTGEDINAAGANAAVTVVTLLARKFIKISATHWVSFVAA